MGNLYEMLAVYRNNFRANSEQEAKEILSIIEKVYDVANVNTVEPGKLPWFFYIYNVNMGLDGFKKVISDIGINANVRLMNYDEDKNVSTYQVVLLYK